MISMRLRGATVARLTPDQKAACSNHVGVNSHFETWKTQWSTNLPLQFQLRQIAKPTPEARGEGGFETPQILKKRMH